MVRFSLIRFNAEKMNPILVLGEVDVMVKQLLRDIEYSSTIVDIPESYILMIGFGWKTGTINEVIAKTGLSSKEILELYSIEPERKSSAYINGSLYGYDYDSMFKHSLQYWRGVLEYNIQNLKDKIRYEKFIRIQK